MAACGNDGSEQATAISAPGGGSEPVTAFSARDDGVVAPARSISSSPNAATLAWDAATHPNLRGYRVYYGPESGEYLQIRGHGIDAGTATTYTLTGLPSGRRYYFVVTAVDMSNYESGFSNEVFKDIPLPIQ